MGKKIYNLFYLAYPDIQKWLKETDIVMVPIGSCEQHGWHLPVSTDSIACLVPVERAAVKANVPHVPLVWVGYSPHHIKKPGEGSGTISLRASTYQNLLYDIGRCLIQQGFDKFVYVTRHTSNTKVLDPPMRRIRYETGALSCVFRADAEGIPNIPRLKKILENPPEETPGWHGSEIETSEVLAYNPELVHVERYPEKDIPQLTHAPKWFPEGFSKRNGNPYVTFDEYDGAWVPMEHPEYSDTGLIGNPSRGSREKGEKIAEIVSDYLATFLNGLRKVKVEVRNREYIERAF